MQVGGAINDKVFKFAFAPLPLYPFTPLPLYLYRAANLPSEAKLFATGSSMPQMFAVLAIANACFVLAVLPPIPQCTMHSAQYTMPD